MCVCVRFGGWFLGWGVVNILYYVGFYSVPVMFEQSHADYWLVIIIKWLLIEFAYIFSGFRDTEKWRGVGGGGGIEVTGFHIVFDNLNVILGKKNQFFLVFPLRVYVPCYIIIAYMDFQPKVPHQDLLACFY